MNRLALAVALPIAAIGLCAASSPASIQSPASGGITIMGNSQAKACSEHAFMVAEGKMSPRTAVETCTEALSIEVLNVKDLAATYNNRGVVRLGMLDEAHYSIEDFDAAVKIEPNMAEGYINRGAYLLKEQRFAEAIAEIEKGLALNPGQPWRAYYNRAVARENTQDLRGAYQDYMKAAELKPDWDAPKIELARFSVRRQP